MLDLSHCRIPPYAHQIVGIEKLVSHPFFFITDEMGAGKTKQCIDAAQVLYQQDVISKVLILTPAAVRGVWFDQELGEIKKHAWEMIPHSITEFHGRLRVWHFGQKIEKNQSHLRWMISNYEFIRTSKARLQQLVPFLGGDTLLILDESSAVKNYRAEQTKACMFLRKACGRVILLNGTPIANSPADLFSQGQLLNKNILECKTYFHFRSKYAVLGGFLGKQIVGWRNLEDIQRRFAPYVLRRLKKDCLDLPDKLPPIILSVPMTNHTWAIYREMRDEMVAWLAHDAVSISAQAVVKGMRLAQITSGFLGGVQEAEPQDTFDLTGDGDELDLDTSRPSFIPRTQNQTVGQPLDRKMGPPNAVQEIGREKLDAYLDWVSARLEEDANLKLLTWCRFRPELARVMRELKVRFPHVSIGAIWGGQSHDRYKTIDGVPTLVKAGERDDSIRLLSPSTTPDGPVIVVGTTATGSMGLNLTAAHVVVYLSNDFSLKTRLQSEDRVHRPGQTHHVSYTDIIATGPTGQKTVDHIIMKALRHKEDLANWTTSAWIHALKEEWNEDGTTAATT